MITLSVDSGSEAEHDEIVELAPDVGAMVLLLTLGKSHCDCGKVSKPQ